MTENEDILDSGQITPSPNEHLEYLPELDLSEKRFATIEWKPVVKGGSSFKSHTLHFPDDKTLKFVANKGTWFFGSIFFLPVFVLFGFWILAIVYSISVWNILGFFFFLFSFFMILTLVETMTAPSIFDKELGLFWKKRATLPRIFNPKGNFVVKLEDIQAIQLLRQNIRSKKKTYSSYEINLVLENNQRLNVVDQGEGKKVLIDAQFLADFLEVPLLNGLDRN